MKRVVMLVSGAMLVAAGLVFAQETKPESTPTTAPAKQETKKEAAAPPVTLTGEVVDLYCYMSHGGTAVGAEHLKCAQSCIKKGLPVGFVSADGTVYLITGKDHEPANAALVDWAGKKSSITGVVFENKSLKSIELVSIAEAK